MYKVLILLFLVGISTINLGVVIDETLNFITTSFYVVLAGAIIVSVTGTGIIYLLFNIGPALIAGLICGFFVTAIILFDFLILHTNMDMSF